ncbi:STAS domain-containing protein [Bacillus alkalicellulosilyticus]|uniref:STAS domain-containing protein n=1 Tax=Alkalihalobacterium alkalicellulosilyticum TaxID=1912214 RepID=UPI000996FF50|nr:STAS domain-containing protein [Bacillus alkalicellulosilyticus]
MKKSIEIENTVFSWDSEKGQMSFEGQDIFVFWIETAMKSFLDTIEEVSGDDAASVVLHTAGFRLGEIVSDFFKKGDIIDIIHYLPNVYSAAGWGKVEIVSIEEETKQATIRIKDSWEYKINRLQEKTQTGSFLPGHWAGILTGLFGTNIGAQVVKSQVVGDEYDEFHCSPTTQSPIENIHDYARLQEQKEIERLEVMVAKRTENLTNLVKEISSPIIPVLDNIVVIPLLGKYDEVRANDMINSTMQNLPKYSANYLILDLTGMDEDIDDYTVSLIQNLTDATALLGTKSVLVGISPKLGIKLTKSQYDLTGIECFSTLKHAIHFSLAQEGKQIIGK